MLTNFKFVFLMLHEIFFHDREMNRVVCQGLRLVLFKARLGLTCLQ